MTTQNLWDAARAVLRGKFTASTALPQETRKTSNRQPNFTPKTTEKKKNKNNSRPPLAKLVEGKKSYRSEQNKQKRNERNNSKD